MYSIIHHQFYKIYTTPSLNQLVFDFERQFDVFSYDGVTWKAPTGEKYQAICSNGIKKEGEPCKTYDTELEALGTFEAVLAGLALKFGRKKATLYWRLRPKIWTAPNKFCVRSRFLLSEKPIDMAFVLNQIDYWPGFLTSHIVQKLNKGDVTWRQH